MAEYVYATKRGLPSIAASQAMGRDIPGYHYFIDEAGEDIELTALLRTVQPGDTVIVGTITDFMTPEIEDMLNTLEDFNDNDIAVESRMQPDYSIELYRIAIRLAIEIIRVREGLKPI